MKSSNWELATIAFPIVECLAAVIRTSFPLVMVPFSLSAILYVILGLLIA